MHNIQSVTELRETFSLVEGRFYLLYKTATMERNIQTGIGEDSSYDNDDHAACRMSPVKK